MEIRELKYFLAIANYKSISKAAQSLYLTQPSLSRQMQNLEKEIGKQLFIRGSKSITLTEAGQLLKKRAEEIIELSEKTALELIDDENAGGDIYIAGGESHAIDIVARAAKQLQMENNNVRIHFQSEDTAAVSERLQKGLIDFGILVEPADLSNFEYVKLPKKDNWGVLMKEDSPLAKKKYIELIDLQDCPIICSRHSINTGVIKNFENVYNKKLNIVATYNLIYNASIMVKEGIGYAIGLDKIINTKESGLCFVPLTPITQVNIYLAWKKNQTFTRCCKNFIENLKELINSSI